MYKRQVKSQTDIESVDCGGYKQVWDNSHLFFLYLAIDNLVPSVLASVSIAPDLSVNASINGLRVEQSIVDSFFSSSKVEYFSQLNNFLVFCKESSSKKDPLKQFSESLQLLVDSEDDDVKMKFLCEQFSLQQRSLNNRRYSASLLSVSLLIFSHSQSAYRAILEEDILCIPSERTLKRMTSKLSLTSEESNFTYFEKRIESLNSYDKHVLLIIIIIIDEIYVASTIE